MSAAGGGSCGRGMMAQQLEDGGLGPVRLVRAGSTEDARPEAGGACRCGPGWSAAGPDGVRGVGSWPLVVLAVPAAVAVWSGWVGIGRLTGFGVVRPLPGIWDSLHLDTAVTLPVGVEAYAAFALRAWLSGAGVVSGRTRRFAGWSAAGSLRAGRDGTWAW